MENQPIDPTQAFIAILQDYKEGHYVDLDIVKPRVL